MIMIFSYGTLNNVSWKTRVLRNPDCKTPSEIKGYLECRVALIKLVYHLIKLMKICVRTWSLFKKYYANHVFSVELNWIKQSLLSETNQLSKWNLDIDKIVSLIIKPLFQTLKIRNPQLNQ